jgi:hypothetical protein
MKAKSTFALASLALSGLWFSQSVAPAGPYPLAPLYSYVPPIPQASSNYLSSGGVINLSSVPPATTVAAAQQEFDSRAAATICADAAIPLPSDNTDNGEDYHPYLLAKWAYPEYFNDDPQGTNRSNTYDAILNHSAGEEGTKTSDGSHDEYDFCLNFYIPMAYRYYAAMPPNVSDYFINHLMGDATLSGVPTGRPGVGGIPTTLAEYIHIPDIIDIPETENHQLGIETARYLANQLLYQRTQDPNYDNLRNGDIQNGAVHGTDWILSALLGFLLNDFQEYNARPYQDMDMSALLNLASYAYDDRVRLAARMVLDYLSAKVAVSSSDLRRAPPFRRRNEIEHYGPVIPGGNFLASPLDSGGEADPQTAFYALLAGNTGTFPGGQLSQNFNWEMVHAGLCDYRISSSILDLFVNDPHRRFYQYLQHDAGNNEFADELYAASPSYLITAGGHPTTYCYRADIMAAPDVILAAISAALAGLPAVVAEQILQNALTGQAPDLGSAMPSSFMPTGSGHFMSDMIQFGEYTTDESQIHMGVAPDFVCGDSIYLPPQIANDPNNVTNGNWTFVNQGGPSNGPGFYLAIYQVDNGNGGQCGFMEAYDTWIHPMFFSTPAFDQFIQNVLAANPSINLQFGNNQANSYVTQSGDTIQFTISPYSHILSTTQMTPAPAYNGNFASGTVLNSGQGSGLVVISNPSLGTSITLDMRDMWHPMRTSETGQVEYGGQEVWVNFNYGDNAGDFAQPYRTLANATNGFGSAFPATVFKIMAGTESESITINRPVKLVAVGGPVTIRGQ